MMADTFVNVANKPPMRWRPQVSTRGHRTTQPRDVTTDATTSSQPKLALPVTLSKRESHPMRSHLNTLPL